MPSKNVIKKFEIGATFHAFNRGVEKRQIFFDNQDYFVFLNLLKRYLDPNIDKKNEFLLSSKPLVQLYNEVELHAFCLMPNHYHLLLTQNTINGMTKLLRRVATSYTCYFNKKYDRVGALYQGTYKASRIYSERRFEKIMEYIHYKNPQDLGVEPEKYQFSSLKREYGWVRPRARSDPARDPTLD